jgi:hypothetical protein
MPRPHPTHYSVVKEFRFRQETGFSDQPQATLTLRARPGRGGVSRAALARPAGTNVGQRGAKQGRRPGGTSAPLRTGTLERTQVGFCGIAALTRLNSAWPPPFVLHGSRPCGCLHTTTLASQVLCRLPWSGRADASGHVVLHATACRGHTTCLVVALQPGRSLFWGPRSTVMGRVQQVAVPCRECRRSPVEVLRKTRTRILFWCPQCRAIWVVDRTSLLTEPNPTRSHTTRH